MLHVHFLDIDTFRFSHAQRSAISQSAECAELLARQFLPLSAHLHLLAEVSADVLETGDNASTLAPHLIRWWADPSRDIIAVARAHLPSAFAHEAFHAARFRRLGKEAGIRS